MITQLQETIIKLKQEKDIAIAAHSYQAPEILEIADITGDSFLLSQKAKNLNNQTILVCGVRFMADTVKILSPDKKVILAAPEATCPMAEQISPSFVQQYKKSHPTHIVAAYINTTTALKAVCDVCLTSSSAVQIIKNIPSKDILFIPDKNLGAYIQKQVPDKNIHLVDGMCPVHNALTEEDVIQAKQRYPGAKVLMHPECPPEAVRQADFVGSTSAIIKYAMECDADCIIGTEKSIADYLSYRVPGRKFIVLNKKLICPDMRITNLSDVYNAITGQGGEEIIIDETLRLAAKQPIDKMLMLGQ